ncbi:hypothetical protein HELRODRAFT_179846 [Helobdella robusta]|uniref:Uncharacterized protein n=1 Tax=Helobdella robusta TaxID=6412 RepID=T1FF75_HELRO|nr:hypothetical protein HELRODRAFT_179846 [Helobdella robusta]ESN95000.1 hypothetical protein HELRODRAFT_179846 [Helobdella robusta]
MAKTVRMGCFLLFSSSAEGKFKMMDTQIKKEEDDEEEDDEGMDDYSQAADYLAPKPQANASKRAKKDDDEDDVKIESYINKDPTTISVKAMRKLIPKLRIECYYSEQEISGKKKLKHLWDQKPTDWPNSVPFKDPNNPGKDGTTGLNAPSKKPGKQDLKEMYVYLKKCYIEKQQQLFNIRPSNDDGDVKSDVLTSQDHHHQGGNKFGFSPKIAESNRSPDCEFSGHVVQTDDKDSKITIEQCDTPPYTF